MALNEGKMEPGKGRLSWGWLLVFVVMIGLLTIFALKLSDNTPPSLGIGLPVPEFSFETFAGQRIDTSVYSGKVLLVNFWASWCQPCQMEAADLQAAWEMYQPTGQVTFLGVNCQDSVSDALLFLQKYGITYPNGADNGSEISSAFGVTGVPETFIIDQQGQLAYRWIGQFSSLAEVTDAIDSLLAQ